MRKNLKKFTAVAITVAMTAASSMTVFATDMSGDGNYEGGEMQYPAISITFPTVPEGIDYIADPNELITSTFSGDAAKGKYKGYDFSGDTGIYFKTKQKSGDPVVDRGLYSPESAPMVVTNENAQDVTVKVTLSKTSEASGDVVYAESPDFSGDTAKKVYLAVTDNTNTAALSATENAVVTTDIAGNTDNFEANYDSATDKYGYKVKSGDLTWNDATYKLTGAINKAADWKEDNIGVPDIKVTWEYAEKVDNAAPSVADVTYSIAAGGDLNIPYSLGAGALGKGAVTDVAIEFGGKVYSINGGWDFPKDGAEFFSIEAGKVVIKEAWMSYYTEGEYTIYLQYDNDNSLEEGTYAAVKLTVGA